MKACKCGTTRTSVDAVPLVHYSILSMLKLLWGMSAIPQSVEFQCKKCGEIFDSLSPTELKEYKY